MKRRNRSSDAQHRNENGTGIAAAKQLGSQQQDHSVSGMMQQKWMRIRIRVRMLSYAVEYGVYGVRRGVGLVFFAFLAGVFERIDANLKKL